MDRYRQSSVSGGPVQGVQAKDMRFLAHALAWIVLLPVFVLGGQTARAQRVVVLTDDRDLYPLGLHLAILEDPDGQWTIDDVTAPPLADRFVPSNAAIPSFGYTSSVYWVRFSVQNDASSERHWMLEIYNKSLDRIELFIPIDATQYASRLVGDGFPFNAREVPARNFVFHLPDSLQAAQTLYVRFASRATLSFPMRIWRQEAWAQRGRRVQFVVGIFFGILLVMVLYNLLLYLSIRDVSFLYYVLHILAYLFYQLGAERISFEYFWPANLWWADISNSFFGLLTHVTHGNEAPSKSSQIRRF